MKSLAIDIAVGGRFHADKMATALAKEGHQVRLFTSLPKERFQSLPKQVALFSFLWPEIVFRAFKKLGRETLGSIFKMRSFGKSVAKAQGENVPADICVSWSSFGLESIRKKRAGKHVVVRDSAHIEYQVEILEQEYQKQGLQFPDHKEVIRRETEEYALADKILVLSDFALGTFLSKGIAPEKLHKIRLGTDLSLFQPRPNLEVSGPIRVVYFGALSLQKGLPYLLEATAAFSPSEIQLTLVGDIDPELRPILEKYTHFKRWPPMAHTVLAPFLRSQDVFVLPSLHDGFGMVVPQAMASGLVPLVSRAAGAAELIQDEKNGLLIYPGSAHSIHAALESLLLNPDKLLALKRSAAQSAKSMSWDAYGKAMAHWIQSLSEPLPALKKAA